jgi:DNA-binding NarL/FixJ family response regulator
VASTVLIVDDNARFRARARHQLESGGYAVIAEAGDAAEALDAAARHHPQVVLLDIQLPDMNGIAVAQRMTSDGGAPRVVLTSTHDATDYGDCIQSCGAAGFIPKAELSPERLAALLA